MDQVMHEIHAPNGSLAENVTQAFAEVVGIENFVAALVEESANTPQRAVDSPHGHHAHAGHAAHEHAMPMMEHSMGMGMDHGMMMRHGGMGGHHMMKMWFHGGCEEVILFDFWRVNTFSGFILSCIVIFIMGTLYEGIKWFRVHLQMSADVQQPCINLNKSDQKILLEGGCSNGDVYAPTTTPPIKGNSSPRVGIISAQSPLAPMRMIQAGLYAIQLTLAYWLMLIAMTYNSWLTAAVILGAAFGHWLFAVLKCLNPVADNIDSFATDACH